MKGLARNTLAAIACAGALAGNPGGTLALHGQGTFQNLDFESATIPPLPVGQYGTLWGTSAAAAIPGWTAYLGSSPAPGITYNNVSAGSANVSLLGPNWNTSFGLPIIAGNYSVLLQAGTTAGPVSTSIAQTGAIPSWAQSIQVKTFTFGPDVLGVNVGGNNISMVPLASGSAYTLYGGDISAFAGQTQQLTIAAVSLPNFHFGQFVLDDIVFSPTPLPEPSAFGLGLASAAALGWLCWRRRK